MSTIVGCPICHARLAVTESSAGSVVCPRCKTRISWAQQPSTTTPPATNAVPPAPHSTTQSTSPPLTPSCEPSAAANRAPLLAGVALPANTQSSDEFDLSLFAKPKFSSIGAPGLPAENIPANSNAPNITDNPPAIQNQSNDATINLSKSPGQPIKSVHVAILKRKRKQRLRFLLLNSTLALITLAMIGLVAWRISRTSESTTERTVTSSSSGSSGQVLEATTGKTGSAMQLPEGSEASELSSKHQTSNTASADQTGKQTSIAADSNLASDAPPLEPVEPPKPPKFLFFSPKEVADIWKEIKPNLVQLEIEGELGRQKAVGLIVDSRGWILTSHQAVKDATRVHVSAAVEPLNQASPPPLVDIARGHIANDPRYDLAILAINRRFVVSFATPRIGDRDRMVAQERLLSVAPPSPTNYYGSQEVYINQRATVDELAVSARSRIESWKIGFDQLSWLSLAGQTEWLPGTPLVGRGGTIQAMVSFSNANNQALAVPLIEMNQLLQRADGQLKPFKLNLAHGADGRVGLIDSKHPAQQIKVELKRAAMACRDFGWVPQDADQYRAWVKLGEVFAKSHDHLKSVVENFRTPPEEVAANRGLQEQVAELENEIQDRFEQALETEAASLTRMNELADEYVRKAKTQGSILIYAEVLNSGLQVDQFVVQSVGCESYFLIPFDSSARVLRPGTRWLMIVNTVENDRWQSLKLGQSKEVRAWKAEQKVAFGPLK